MFEPLRHAVAASMLALAAVASLGACAAYRPCGFAGCAGDAQIRADVEARLAANRALESWGIQVQALDRVVYLYGIVDTELERRIIEATALEAPGVRRVVNSIAVRNSVW